MLLALCLCTLVQLLVQLHDCFVCCLVRSLLLAPCQRRIIHFNFFLKIPWPNIACPLQFLPPRNSILAGHGVEYREEWFDLSEDGMVLRPNWRYRSYPRLLAKDCIEPSLESSLLLNGVCDFSSSRFLHSHSWVASGRILFALTFLCP